jgi:hypothetical protein
MKNATTNLLNQLSSKHNGHNALKNTKNIENNPITLSFNIHLQTNKTYKCQTKEKTKEDELWFFYPSTPFDLYTTFKVYNFIHVIVSIDFSSINLDFHLYIIVPTSIKNITISISHLDNKLLFKFYILILLHYPIFLKIFYSPHSWNLNFSLVTFVTLHISLCHWWTYT